MAKPLPTTESVNPLTGYDSTKQFLPEDGYPAPEDEIIPTTEGSGSPSDNPPTETQNGVAKILGDQEPYSPNDEGKSFTGAGIEANLGENSTDQLSYSWEQQGHEKAKAQLGIDTQTVNQNFQTNRQTLATNAVNYQTQADMMQYQNNQNAEKVGWTGGYVLDQNRQMDYLKASIQAQMYGAMELQKYGYDSSLAAARLSYDLNQQEYARQYYQDAVSAALSEAQLTGTYFSAEVKDMMSQLKVAELKQEDQSLSDEERDQAKHLSEQIESWFSTNGISKQGVKTLAAWQAEQDNELARTQANWNMYNAALQAANSEKAKSATAFLRYTFDENGRPTIEYNTSAGGEIGIIDMYNMPTEKLIAYMNQTYTDAAGNKKTAINEMARQQVQSFVNYLYNDAVAKATKIEKKDGVEESTFSPNATYIKAINSIKEMVEKINNELNSTIITDPTPADQQEENDQQNLGLKGEWIPQTIVKLVGDNETKNVTLSSLSYSNNWEDKDSNPIATEEAKTNTIKASISISENDLPDSWKKSLRDQLYTTGDLTVKTSPIKFEFYNSTSFEGKLKNVTPEIIKQSIVESAKLDSNIEQFLINFYKGVNNKSIETGDILIVDNKILVYNGSTQRSNTKFFVLALARRDYKKSIASL